MERVKGDGSPWAQTKHNKNKELIMDKCKHKEKPMVERRVSWLDSIGERLRKLPHVRVPYDHKHPMLSGNMTGAILFFYGWILLTLIEAIAN